MKIIEALKKVKSNRNKMEELKNLISQNAANMESQKGKTPYGDPKKKITEWLQSICDIEKDNARLLSAIQRTNLGTDVTIEVPSGVQVTKTISEWIFRRREGVDIEIEAYRALSTHLKQAAHKDDTGSIVVDNVILNFSQEKRDTKLMELSEEKSIIDSTLEIVNATTDLI